MSGLIAHAPDTQHTFRMIVAGGSLILLLVIVGAVLIGVRAWMKRASGARPACPGCNHFLEAGETKCPFCGAEQAAAPAKDDEPEG